MSLSFRRNVIDVQPDQTYLEAAAAKGSLSQCERCNLQDFLDSVENLHEFPALLRVRRCFARLVEICACLAERRVDALRRLAQALGGRCQEIVFPGMPAELAGIAKLYSVKHGAEQIAPARSDDVDSTVLIEPHVEGPPWVAATIERIAALGHRRVAVGFYEHAVAVDQWARFCERDGFDVQWHSMLLRARGAEIADLGFFMAYPACAMLQWQANRSLEARRARLDLTFRRLDRESSMMCPENVSGYTLVNDVRSHYRLLEARDVSLAVRTANLLLSF